MLRFDRERVHDGGEHGRGGEESLKRGSILTPALAFELQIRSHHVSSYPLLWVPGTLNFGVKLHEKLCQALRARLPQVFCIQKKVDAQIRVLNYRIIVNGKATDP